MIGPFKSLYSYDYDVVDNWNSAVIGVYYCGAQSSDGKLVIYYIGRAVREGGIRSRLLEHLSEDKWSDVTHFGYHVCDTAQEAIDFEVREIAKCKPKYNTVGVL